MAAMPSSRDLEVLLRHRLLLESHGLQCLLPAQILLRPRDQAVAHGDHCEEGYGARRATALTLHRRPYDYEDTVAVETGDLIDLHRVRPPGLEQFIHPAGTLHLAFVDDAEHVRPVRVAMQAVEHRALVGIEFVSLNGAGERSRSLPVAVEHPDDCRE